MDENSRQHAGLFDKSLMTTQLECVCEERVYATNVFMGDIYENLVGV